MAERKIILKKRKRFTPLNPESSGFQTSQDRNPSGFTLIELVLAISIVAVVSVLAFLGLNDYKNNQSLKLSIGELITVIRDTQRRSISQEEGNQWGIKFTNALGGNSYYEVFKGANYSTSGVDKLYSLKNGVKFTEPYASTTYQARFAPISGVPLQSKIISLVLGQSSDIGDIVINSLGSVFSRIEKGLIGYWHFDEGSGGVVHDSSVFANDGFIYDYFNRQCYDSCPQWLSDRCVIDSCYSFSSYYVDGVFKNAPLTLSAFTIEAWTNFNLSQHLRGNIFTANDADFQEKIAGGFLASSDKPSFFTQSDNGQGTQLDASGGLKGSSWYHLAYVYDGQCKSIYVNGVADKRTECLPNMRFTIYSFYIGLDDNNTIFNGILDQVKFYNRALSPAEILENYNSFK